MDISDLLEQLLVSGVGAGGVVALLLFLSRRALAAWIDEMIVAKVKPLEDRMTKLETGSQLTGQALQTIADTIREGMQRQTTAMEKISETVAEQGQGIARIEGRLDAMQEGR